MSLFAAMNREERRPSPWRERPVHESLQLFQDMRRGLIDEGKATLRCAAVWSCGQGSAFCVARSAASAYSNLAVMLSAV